ncbi:MULTISPECIES: hypothetical protein [Flavobacterium]|uniref:Uncharacterized protein n=1 Tax=Flavobacterium hankyongi TaxID=1176532 RepID=A0ABP8ZXH6_9FLAO|nr:hypothetical protein [Flavobacterium sp. N1846]
MKNNIAINTDDPEFEFIDTQVISELKVFRQHGLEIKGVAGNAITGIKDEGYKISILGISYPFYEEEFPHHVEHYENMFKKNKKTNAQKAFGAIANFVVNSSSRFTRNIILVEN